jgi:hypothetical protein
VQERRGLGPPGQRLGRESDRGAALSRQSGKVSATFGKGERSASRMQHPRWGMLPGRIFNYRGRVAGIVGGGSRGGA